MRETTIVMIIRVILLLFSFKKIKILEKELSRNYNSTNKSFDQQPFDDSLNRIPSLFSSNISLPQGHLGSSKMQPLIKNFSFSPIKVKSADDLIPKCPYYELPAGMMVPLISLENCLVIFFIYYFYFKHFKFEPLDSLKLRIPAPEPPSESLLTQVDRFYAMDGIQDNLLDKYVFKIKIL